jgi:hypothetical protein
VVDHRRRDHVALRVGELLLFPADLETQREKRTSLRNSSVTVGAQEHGAIENEAGTKSYHSKGSRWGTKRAV